MIMRDNSGNDDQANRRFEDVWPVDDFDAASRFLQEVFRLDEGEAKWPDGSRLGDYVLMERLGEGGSGVAYLARRAGSQQLATVKIFKQVGDHRAASRELEALINTNCAVIPKLYEVNEQAGHLYVAYEYADGVSLIEYATKSCGCLSDRVRLLADVASAMQTMHEQGLITATSSRATSSSPTIGVFCSSILVPLRSCGRDK